MNNLEKSREINLLLLKRFREVCDKHHITWFIDGGTLLGGARHQGFIPWDDDVDVIMDPVNYAKLLKIPDDEWGADFEIARYSDNTTYFKDFITRLYYTGASMEVKSRFAEGAVKFGDQMDLEQHHLGLDVFVMENTYDQMFLHRFVFIPKLYMLYGLAAGHRREMDRNENQYGVMKKWVLVMLMKVGKHFSLERIYGMLKKMLAKKRGVQHCCTAHAPFPYVKKLHKWEWFAGSVDIPFCDETFPAPVGYREYLANIYGDYLAFPPEDKRVPEHLVNPYAEYAEQQES